VIEDIFSIPVYKNKIYISKEEYEFIVSRKRIPNSFMNETTEDKFVLDNLELKNLRNQCQQHFQAYANDIMCFDKCSLEITQSWVNFNKKGSSHHTHCHPNSIVSAVFYLTESPSDLVMFKQMHETLLPAFKKPNRYNSMAHEIHISKNDILLFPSYVHHGVKMNEQEEERISIAINSFYTGELGSIKDATYLRVK